MSIILFDGVCNLCNGVVNFIIDRDPGGRFRFVPLQSEKARELLRPFGIDDAALNSIVLIQEGKIFTRSGAVLEIVRHLRGFWPLLSIFKVIPAFIRDVFYNYVARNRYRIFGQSETCRIPTPELEQRFQV